MTSKRLAAKSAIEFRQSPRADGEERFGPVDVEGKGAADSNDFEWRFPVVSVHKLRNAGQPGCHDGDLVSTPNELGPLAMDVLGDAPEHRVVVVADYGDLERHDVSRLRARAAADV